MGGSRCGIERWVLAIMTTFAVSGLWHGANWTYVAWGALNGVYLLAGTMSKGVRQRFYGMIGFQETSFIRQTVGIVVTFVLVLAGWVLFRARNLNDASYVFSHFFSNWDFGSIKTQQFQLKYFPAAIAGLIVLEAVEVLQPKLSLTSRWSKAPGMLRWATYIVFIFGVILSGVFRQTQFIYFQF